MNVVKVLFAVMLGLVPSAAFARSHRLVPPEVIDGLGGLGVIGSGVNWLYDNVAHALEHAFRTVLILIENPSVAMERLNILGENCFAAAPPASHTLFANAESAVTSTVGIFLLLIAGLYFVLKALESRILSLLQSTMHRFGIIAQSA